MNERHLKITSYETIPLRALPVSQIIFEEFITAQEQEVLKNLHMPAPKKSHDPFLSESYSVLNDLKLKNLISKFDACVEFYASTVLEFPIKFRMVGSWLTKNTIDTYHHQHAHPNCFLSVVSYFGDDYDRENYQGAGIKFFNNGLNNIFNFNLDLYNIKDSPPSNWNIFNSVEYTIKTTKNQVIIFPAQLHHSSEICNSHERFCVGANYHLSGSYGSVDGKNLITF